MTTAIQAYTHEHSENFLATLKYPPNTFQREVMESVAFGDGNIVVSALAGSGKTSLLVMIANLLVDMKRFGIDKTALFLAFNVKIREELKERLPAEYSGCAINSHSLGNQLLKEINRNAKIDWKKWPDLCQDAARRLGAESNTEARIIGKKIENLASKVMLSDALPHSLFTGVPDNTTFDAYEAIDEVAAHFGMEDDLTENMAREIVAIITKSKRIFETTGACNFDEQLYWPVVMNVQPPKYDFIFVDECQDLNKLQLELALRSVKPDGRIVSVGDVHQAIYGFAGADAESFHNIIERTNARVLPLNITYRCPTSVVDLAARIVPALQAAPGAHEGIIEHKTDDDLVDAPLGSLVMCRTTAPLVSMYFKLIGKRVPAKILGREVGRMLSKALDEIERMRGFSYKDLPQFINDYEKREVDKLVRRNASEGQIESTKDMCECLRVVGANFDDCTSIACLKDELDKLFGKDDEKGDNIISLCTVHRAKGLEAENVFILKPEKMPLVWPDQLPWEFEQEMNIKYVALTRSLNRLTFLYGKDEDAQAAQKAQDTKQLPLPEPVEEDEFFDDPLLELPKITTAQPDNPYEPVMDAIDESAEKLKKIIRNSPKFKEGDTVYLRVSIPFEKIAVPYNTAGEIVEVFEAHTKGQSHYYSVRFEAYGTTTIGEFRLGADPDTTLPDNLSYTENKTLLEQPFEDDDETRMDDPDEQFSNDAEAATLGVTRDIRSEFHVDYTYAVGDTVYVAISSLTVGQRTIPRGTQGTIAHLGVTRLGNAQYEVYFPEFGTITVMSGSFTTDAPDSDPEPVSAQEASEPKAKPFRIEQSPVVAPEHTIENPLLTPDTKFKVGDVVVLTSDQHPGGVSDAPVVEAGTKATVWEISMFKTIYPHYDVELDNGRIITVKESEIELATDAAPSPRDRLIDLIDAFDDTQIENMIAMLQGVLEIKQEMAHA